MGSKLDFPIRLTSPSTNRKRFSSLSERRPRLTAKPIFPTWSRSPGKSPRSIKDYKIVVGKSTVPVYTSEWVRRIMLLNGAPAHLFDVASNPEFLREGTAVTDFLYPDRIVIGTDNAACSGASAPDL